jgi:hypothetical protein
LCDYIDNTGKTAGIAEIYKKKTVKFTGSGEGLLECMLSEKTMYF